jgi:uroporphyrinogen III methyltransferase / synthase
MLTAEGAKVAQVVVYESRDIAAPNADILAAMNAGHIAWTIVTSSAIARSLIAMFGETLRKTQLIAISPLTAETLAELGYSPAAVAEIATTDGVIAVILAAERGKL